MKNKNDKQTIKPNKNIKFIDLIKRRRELSKDNKKNIKNVSSKDPQLIDVIDNFNEGKEYKLLKKI